MKIEMTSIVDLDVDTLARVFCALDDDQMCKFFVKVAELAEGWPNPAENMWYYVGGHLRKCECSTDGARAMIRSIAWHMEHSDHS